MSIAFLTIGLILALGGLGTFIYFLKDFIIEEETLVISRKNLLKWIICLGVFAIGAAFLSSATNTWGGEEGWQMDAGHAALAVSGALLWAAMGLTFWGSFALNYYKKGLSAQDYKIIRIVMYLSFVLSIIFFLVFAEGVAPYLSYPLYNGIAIGGDNNIISFTTPKSSVSGGLHITFYAVCILTGVVLVYFICDHEFYKHYGQHGLLLPVCVIGFACGILGARIWYVVGNWTVDGFDKNPLKIFEIWTGGLTIIGGAVFGMIGGIITFWFSKKLKREDLRWGLDVIIPTILIAQAFGRWGNFFNCEVHGNAVYLNEGWQWLPTWISNNMHFSSTAATLGPNQIYVPLFLIEALANIAGYFVIRFFFLGFLGKYLAKGDGLGLYFIWYGVVRIIMEPMRYGAYNMGESGSFSIWGSLSYIIIGVVAIGGFELWRYLEIRKAKQDHGV